MAISRPCPKCQQPLSIPEPIPEKLQCAKCGTVIKFKTTPAAAKEEAPKPTPPVVKPVAPPPPKPVADPRGFVEEAPPAKKSPTIEEEPARATGILSYLHTVIPKPVLFGSYGALGGLLGVLLLGELFWLLLNPTPQELKPLVVAVSSELKLFPGSRNTLKIKIARYGFTGPVRLEPIDLPLELQLPVVTIPAGETDAEIPIGASPKAAEGVHNINLRVMAVDDAKIKVNESIQIWIQPTPASLGLTVSPIVTVYAAGQNRFGFMVARQRFEGPVRVEVLDLPKGINIPLVTVQEKDAKGEFSVAVDKDAKLGYQIMEVDVHSLADHKIFCAGELSVECATAAGEASVSRLGAGHGLSGDEEQIHRQDRPARVQGTNPDRSDRRTARRHLLARCRHS